MYRKRYNIDSVIMQVFIALFHLQDAMLLNPSNDHASLPSSNSYDKQ